MVSISRETSEQTARRLREVLRRAELEVLPGPWAFLECPVQWWRGPRPGAVAAVLDDQVASELVPCEAALAEQVAERFGVFSFHFAEQPENSGFVGWLAGELKARLGTGVFVICGYNSRRGGVFDYWGVPYDQLEPALGVVEELARARSRSSPSQ